MDKIKKIWFDNNRIFMMTMKDEVYNRPLEAFPILKEANSAERNDFKIGSDGDDARWEHLDEDIHISSFFDKNEPELDNEIARIFKRFPQLNVSEVAHSIGISKSLLAKYIDVINRPSEERKNKIKEA